MALGVALGGCQTTPDSSPQSPPIDSVAYRDSLARATAARIAYDRYWNDLARYLGGLEGSVNSLLAAEEREPAAVSHRKWFDKVWAEKEAKILRELKSFAQRELGAAYSDTGTVIYPFASFDFLHLYYLYPSANRYILFGLEDEGHLPNMRELSTERRAANVGRIRQSLNDILPLSFSMTNDMKVELAGVELDGTAPLLMAFLARTGHEVLRFAHIRIAPEGNLAEGSPTTRQNANDGVITGIRIDFRTAGNPGNPVRSVYYFSQDASDNGLESRPEFAAFLRTLPQARGFCKAASYLMHKPYFSTVRTALLESWDFLVQDDSGVPFRFFKPTDWKLQGYGAYGPSVRPIPLFANWYQEDYADFFASTDIRPLPFGIGYRYRAGESNWLVAQRR